MDPKCLLTSTDLQTRRAGCQHQLSFLFFWAASCVALGRYIISTARADLHYVSKKLRLRLVSLRQAVASIPISKWRNWAMVIFFGGGRKKH